MLANVALASDRLTPPDRTTRSAVRVDDARAAARPILVVDDDPEILAMLRDFLESEGLAVRTAANGAEALEALDEVMPALILLDMRMPVLDGWAFAKRFHGR